MHIREGYSYDDLMLVPQHGVLHSRKDADIQSRVFPDGLHVTVPIISANMPSVTGAEMAFAMEKAGGFGAIHRFNTIEEQWQEYKRSGYLAIISIGLEDGFVRTERFSSQCTYYLLDVAHGDSERVVEFVEKWKKHFSHKRLMVGNVATDSATRRLAEVGADAIKIGIGPGAACTTREVTGFGYPQLSAIYDCSRIKDEFDINIVADGGIKNSGDIVKALAAGADTVMIGSLLAGCNEAPNPGYYWGNASAYVNGHNAPEGVSGNVTPSGPVAKVMKQLAWGIRSGISYAGARNLEELRENAEWVRVTPGTLQESRARI